MAQMTGYTVTSTLDICLFIFKFSKVQSLTLHSGCIFINCQCLLDRVKSDICHCIQILAIKLRKETSKQQERLTVGWHIASLAQFKAQFYDGKSKKRSVLSLWTRPGQAFTPPFTPFAGAWISEEISIQMKCSPSADFLIHKCEDSEEGLFHPLP